MSMINTEGFDDMELDELVDVLYKLCLEGIESHTDTGSKYSNASLRLYTSMKAHIDLYKQSAKQENDNV